MNLLKFLNKKIPQKFNKSLFNKLKTLFDKKHF
jgi:hypothetical protein